MKTKKENAEVGVIVGRFQAPELHAGHQELIQRVVSIHPRVLVFVGLAADVCKCTYNNPLDFPTRKAMIEKAFPTVEVLYIKDKGNNEIWSKELDSQIATQIGPSQKVTLYGSRDGFVEHYRGKYHTEELVPTKFISAKEIRKNVGVRSKATPEFREGVIWAVENQWPSTLPTVDVAILDLPKERVLVCRKPNEGLVRFVGGFSQADSESYEADAEREVREETHLKCKNFTYLASTKIDDWRFRNERNKIKTTFFSCDYNTGIPEADDDIAEVEWKALLTLIEDDFIPEHRVLFRILKEKVIDKTLKISNTSPK